MCSIGAVVAVFAVGAAGMFAVDADDGEQRRGCGVARGVRRAGARRDRERGRARRHRPAAARRARRVQQPAIDLVSASCRGSRCSARPPISPRSTGVDFAITDGTVEADERTSTTSSTSPDAADQRRRSTARRCRSATCSPTSSLTTSTPELDDSTSSELDVPLTAVEGRPVVPQRVLHRGRAGPVERRPAADIPESGIEPTGGDRRRTRST